MTRRFWLCRAALAVLTGALAILLTPTFPGDAQASPLAQSAPDFYYYHKQRIPLTLDTTRVAARLTPALSPVQKRTLVESAPELGDFDSRFELPAANLTLLPVRAGADPVAARTRLNRSAGVDFATPVYAFADGSQYVLTDEFLVRFRKDVTQAQRDAFLQARGAQLVSTLAGNPEVLVLRATNPRVTSALALANAFAEDNAVDYAEPNFAILKPVLPDSTPAPAPSKSNTPQSPTLDPNDPYFYPQQWSLYDHPLDPGIQLPPGPIPNVDIKARRAWDITTGSSAIIIAILDEGVDSTHPDLAGKLVAGYNATDSGSASTTNPSDPRDVHGTEAAGVAAAATNNGVGVAGACWNCRIMPIKVAYRQYSGPSDTTGSWLTFVSWLGNGLNQAWMLGADVLSNSWTLGSASPTVNDAISAAYFNGRCVSLPCSFSNTGYGSTVIFASGNYPTPPGSVTVDPPGGYKPYVIAVGASNWCDQRKTEANVDCNAKEYWWGSKYGGDLDLVAPGLYMVTTSNAASYAYFDGTSAATPLVAGVAGLIYSVKPNFSPDQVRWALQNGAEDINLSGWDSETGWGRLDARNALEMATFNLGVTTGDGQTKVMEGQTLTFTQWITNTGFTTLPSVGITVTLPSGYGFVSSVPPLFTNLGGNVYRYNTGTFVSGTSGSTSITVRVLPGTTGTAQTLTARVGAAHPEWSTGDNVSADTDLVVAPLYLPLVTR